MPSLAGLQATSWLQIPADLLAVAAAPALLHFLYVAMQYRRGLTCTMLQQYTHNIELMYNRRVAAAEFLHLLKSQSCVDGSQPAA